MASETNSTTDSLATHCILVCMQALCGFVCVVDSSCDSSFFRILTLSMLLLDRGQLTALCWPD